MNRKLNVVIATTTGFHLRHLARELTLLNRNVRYLSYLPNFRIRSDGIPLANAQSYFWRLQPWSTAALFRWLPTIRHASVERMLELTDDAVARSLPPCDIFIGLSSMSVKSAKVAREKFGAKIVIDRGARHVLSQNDILSKGQANPLSQLYVDRELASYEQADYISLPSEHAVESFVEKGFDRSRLFKNLYGVDLNRFKPTPKPYGAIKLLFVGGWSLQKGVDVLSNAVAQLQNVTLTHVGQRIDAEFPRLPNFTSLGYADHARLRDVFASHHILVLPSRQDGFGMVLTEALASGLAVIGSRMTGAQDLKQMLKKPQFVGLTEPGDVNGLATAIEEMARVISSEPASREILTEADKFGLSWTAYAKRYDDFITSIC